MRKRQHHEISCEAVSAFAEIVSCISLMNGLRVVILKIFDGHLHWLIARATSSSSG
jgi:hypothetical protein